jgi:hypothetical protein
VYDWASLASGFPSGQIAAAAGDPTHAIDEARRRTS